MEEKNTIEFWKDGEYNARGGYFIRSEIKTFLNKLIESGLEPVGIIADLDSFNLEVIVKE
jgi:hypothetical protein